MPVPLVPHLSYKRRWNITERYPSNHTNGDIRFNHLTAQMVTSTSVPYVILDGIRRSGNGMPPNQDSRKLACMFDHNGLEAAYRACYTLATSDFTPTRNSILITQWQVLLPATTCGKYPRASDCEVTFNNRQLC